MPPGKWIPELTAEIPVADAARLALAKRLEVVRDYLQLALREPDKDTEHVHQLRVGTRRAGAVLEIFAGCLPAKEHKRAKKQLRRIRRTAGEARDWDVFLMFLSSAKPRSARQQPGWDFLTGYALSQRTSAQAHLEASCPDYPFSFERLLAETVASVHKPRATPQVRTLLDLALPLLSGLLRELHQAAADDLDDYAHLHQVRIIGKRLRYAMEIFADCFAPAFREVHYPAVEQMQEILGVVNDSQVAGQRLTAIRDRLATIAPADAKRFRPAVATLIRQHQRRFTQERQRFLDWWAKWQTTGGESAFTTLLKTPEPAANGAGNNPIPVSGDGQSHAGA